MFHQLELHSTGMSHVVHGRSIPHREDGPPAAPWAASPPGPTEREGILPRGTGWGPAVPTVLVERRDDAGEKGPLLVPTEVGRVGVCACAQERASR